jgi:hypothetical protein
MHVLNLKKTFSNLNSAIKTFKTRLQQLNHLLLQSAAIEAIICASEGIVDIIVSEMLFDAQHQ